MKTNCIFVEDETLTATHAMTLEISAFVRVAVTSKAAVERILPCLKAMTTP